MVARVVLASARLVEPFSSARISDLEFYHYEQTSVTRGSQAMMSTFQAVGSYRGSSHIAENA